MAAEGSREYNASPRYVIARTQGKRPTLIHIYDPEPEISGRFVSLCGVDMRGWSVAWLPVLLGPLKVLECARCCASTRVAVGDDDVPLVARRKHHSK